MCSISDVKKAASATTDDNLQDAQKIAHPLARVHGTCSHIKYCTHHRTSGQCVCVVVQEETSHNRRAAGPSWLEAAYRVDHASVTHATRSPSTNRIATVSRRSVLCFTLVWIRPGASMSRELLPLAHE